MINPGMFIADRYEIIDKVGSGGMADVYKARCHKLNRFVAVKVLKPEFSNDRNFVAKFRGEAQSAAGLSHPNIVSVFDVGEDDGLYYIVMELIEGITLKNFIERKGRLDFRESIGIAIQIAQGMEAAHANHIIHRDIKPQNIMISKDGKVKVADFGIAKATTSNTLTSNAMGSVHYISPEQARGGYSDEKSDIYSLGITIYEMISGILPFEGDNAVSIALLHIQGEARTLGELIPGVPISLDRIVQKCMQKKPERRYLSAAELIADLKHAIMEPNVDFVVIQDGMSNNSPTISLSSQDLDAIRNGSGQMDYDQNQMMNNGYNGFPPQNFDDGYNNGFNDNFNNGYNNDEYNNQYGNEDEYSEDEYFNEEENPDEETVDPKVEKVAVIASIAVVVLIGAIFIVVLLKMFNVFGDDSEGSSTAAPTTSAAAEQSAQPTALENGISVPTVAGRSADIAKQMIEQEQLVCQVVEVASDTVPEGSVVGTEPAEGEKVEANSIVKLLVSKGSESVTLESVDKKSKEDAEKDLKSQFSDINITWKYESSDTVGEGYVIKTVPAGGESVPESLSEIEVYVSQGKKVSYVSMPSLVGKSKSDALKELTDLGLKYSTVEAFNDQYDAGKICAQSIKEGSNIPLDREVKLTISKGAESKTYKYSIGVQLSQSVNPFDDPAAVVEGEDTSELVTSGTLTIECSYNDSTIFSTDINSDFATFASSGASANKSFTAAIDSIKQSDIDVVVKLNGTDLSNSEYSASITLSNPTEVN